MLGTYDETAEHFATTHRLYDIAELAKGHIRRK